MAAQFSVNDNKSWKSTFFLIWIGQAFSLLGSQLVQFALIWYLTILTNSAKVLAAASLVGMLPGVILGPFIGTLVDRWNRRMIMLLADSLIALATLTLIALFALDTVGILHIYILMFIRSLAGSFHGTAMSASTSLMVPVESLTRIQGINQMLTGGLNVIAAPMGALLIEVMRVRGILAIDVITALVAVLPLCFISIPQPESAQKRKPHMETQATVWQDFQSGLRYLLGWPGLLIISLMTVGINFSIIPAFSLLPLLVKDYFGGDAIQLGIMESAMGFGVFIGGAILGAWGGFQRKILTSMIGLIGIGIGTLAIAQAPAAVIAVAIGGAFLVGLANPITMGPFFAVIQSNVEPEMQARILSLLSSIGSGMGPLGLIIAGPVADRVGIQSWFFFGGFLCVCMSIVGLFIPAVMNIEADRNLSLRDEIMIGKQIV